MSVAITIAVVLLVAISLAAYLQLVLFLILRIFNRREYAFYKQYREKIGKSYSWFRFSYDWPRSVDLDYRYARARREFFGESRFFRFRQATLVLVASFSISLVSLLFAASLCLR